MAKTKIQKTWVFCCTVYTARKTHIIRGFWHEKRMSEKPRISYWCFGKWCACATSLYLWPYTYSAHYVAGRGRVIPLKVTCHVTKNPNNTGEIGASVYIGKKPVKFWRSFKKSRCGGGFLDSGFKMECLGEPSNFQRKTRMRERFRFFDASVNGTRVVLYLRGVGESTSGILSKFKKKKRGLQTRKQNLVRNYTLLKSDVTRRDHVVHCRGSQECWFMLCQFHSRWHSLRITLKSKTLVCMRSSNAWTTKPWQRS